MVPRLQRFYGGSPMDWLALPTKYLRAFLVMMPRIQAEEAIHATTVIAMGNGLPDKDDQKRIRSAWAGAIDPDETPSERKRVPHREFAANLAAAGIRIKDNV